MTSSEAVLSIREVGKSFKGFQVLTDVSAEVYRGEIVGLMGPNGSGKTTLINIITGLLHQDRGEIVVGGVEISRLPTNRRCLLGINRTFQVPSPFAELTVQENVEVAVRFSGRSKIKRSEEIVGKYGLGSVAQRPASSLNTVQLKQLDLARAMATAPEILLVDEMGAGQSREELEVLAGQLRNIRDEGTSLVVVEHIMEFLRMITDRVIVLNSGKIIFNGDLDAATADADVISAYLGV